ncbi:cap binding protein 80-pb [Moniliophthora roreri MCA 2997]|uniref:Cap binding protein 80-pb n=1 Tax=Moniliophthora roreri (strain MCA 2997) TaxID=1381753 RepID=V2XHE6_MONRO|nr:cap binding protein 80-pb [Moniliophthora roreri MCA 2997]KAI3604334.1 cap binding protein 80-pb [Moniliophthora roreri]
MSYERRGYGGRRRYRDDYDDRRREPIETPQDKLKAAIIKLGEVDPVQELPHIQTQIRGLPPVLSNLSEAFHISVTEQPFKIPYYAALLRLLHEKASEDDTGPLLGKQILEEFWKGFQAYVDKLAWRETRFCVHFFAHLTAAGLVSAESFTALLQSFTAVLDEFGVSHGRGKRAALCAAEGLMIAGTSIKAHSATSVSDIITAIQTFIDTTGNPKWLVQPTLKLHSPTVDADSADELLDSALAALRALEAVDFDGPYPRPYLDYSELDPTFTPFDLPSVLVTPEVIELDGLSNETEESEPGTSIKKDEWPEYYLRLFSDDITPDPNTPAGYAVRTGLLAIIDIFEVNRKECARLLLEYPKWTLPGTFKPKPGAPPPEHEPIVSKDWQLESTLLEILLGSSFVLPESTQKQIYYIGLITEVCKLAPSTGGPAVGKSIRRLFSMLSDGLDVEIARRYSEWFSTHMSNFNFQWVWKEWIPDLALCDKHPKRNFIRRALELEIRLSYYDRIAKSIPQEMHPAEAFCLPSQAPGPDFEYDDPAKPHHDAAQSILNLFRGRAQAGDVIAHLDTLKNNLENESSDSGQLVNVDTAMRSIAIQSLLHIGSRSFSHLLNAIERYLSLLRFIANGGVSEAPGGGIPEAKSDILNAVAAFWKNDKLMVNIVFDKLMQYQIVDPADVVKWTFTNVSETEDELKTPLTLTAFEWSLLKGALDKANGRVTIARRKLAALRKEDDETKARANAGTTGDMDVDDVKPVTETSGAENPALASAIKALSILTREQKNTLSRTLEGFTNCLAPPLSSVSPEAQAILTEKSWHNRANWGRDEWNFWETWAWYRHFCRTYSPYLRSYSATLSTVSFARLEGSKDPAAELLQKIWNVAIGQE